MQHPEIDQYIAALEKDITKAKQLLEEGNQASIAHLRNALDEAGRKHRLANKHDLHEAVETGREALDEVEHAIGEMDFLNAHHKIEEIANFDELFAHLSESLKKARSLVEFTLDSTQHHLEGLSGELSLAWAELHLAMEMVRLEIDISTTVTESKRDEVRQKLIATFEEAKKSHDLPKKRGILYQARHAFDEDAAILKDNLIERLSEHPELTKWAKRQD